MYPWLVAAGLLSPIVYYWKYTRIGTDNPKASQRMNGEDLLYRKLGFAAMVCLCVLAVQLIFMDFWFVQYSLLVTRVFHIATACYFGGLAVRAYRAYQNCSAWPAITRKFRIRLEWSIINCALVILASTRVEY